MTSSRPYLLRAFYEWIVDNHSTPYIVVNADFPAVSVPQQYVEGGRIVLNIAPLAVNDLSLNNDSISFHARFGGIPSDIYIPIRAIIAVYAKESGRGMIFKDNEEDGDGIAPPQPPTGGAVSGGSGGSGSGAAKGGKASTNKKGGGPKLTVVK